jgi:hypothetical protein
MTNARTSSACLVIVALAVLTSACAHRPDPETAALRLRVDDLERQVATLSARVHTSTVPPITVTGTVVDTNGSAATGAVVAVIAGDVQTDGQTDGAGRFSIDLPSGGDGFFYANKNGRSARLQAAIDPSKLVTLALVEPESIEGTVLTDGTPDKVVGYVGPGRVSAVLPGLWGLTATVTGTHFRFDAVPAGDVELSVAVDSKAAAHALVHVEPGKTATMQLTPQPATAWVSGAAESSRTHLPVKVEAFLLMPDGSPEAWYPTDGYFAFGGRTAGDRVILLVAHGYEPRRLPVTLEADRKTTLGAILLEPTPRMASTN